MEALIRRPICGAFLLLTIHIGHGNHQLSIRDVPAYTGLWVTCPEEEPSHVTSTSHVVSEIVSELNLTAAVVITDGWTDLDIQQYEASEVRTPTVVSEYEVSDELMAEDIADILDIYNELTPLTDTEYFIVTCSLNCTIELLEQVHTLEASGPTQGVLAHLAHWVILIAPGHLDALEEYVGNITHLTAVIDVTNDSLPTYKASMGTTHRIYSAFWEMSGRRFIDIGTYTGGRLVMTSQLFPNTPYGFNNRTFTITVNMWGPFLDKNTLGNYTYYDGMCIAMLETLSSFLNFSYVLVEPEDGNWGTLDNGSWTGIVAQLEEKSVDFSIAPLALSTLRETVVDFTFPFYLEYTAVLYGAHKQESHILSFFLQPFHWVVWALLSVAIVFTAGVLTAMATLSPVERRLPLQRNFRNSLWVTLGAFFNQGSVHVPTSMTTRAVFGFFWAFCLVLVATYSGNLVASLTVTRRQAPFSTLEVLAEQNEYVVGTIGGTIWEEMLQTSSTLVYQRIWGRIQDHVDADTDSFNVLDQSTSRHVERAKHGGYAVISDVTTFELEMSKSCDITMMAEKFFALRYAMAFQNNSAYRNIFSNTIIRIHETGLIDVWRRRFWPRIDHCVAPVQMARRISIPDLLGVIFTALGLLCVGTMLLTAELLIYRLNSTFAKCL